jgi:hypothetical protein
MILTADGMAWSRCRNVEWDPRKGMVLSHRDDSENAAAPCGFRMHAGGEAALSAPVGHGERKPPRMKCVALEEAAFGSAYIDAVRPHVMREPIGTAAVRMTGAGLEHACPGPSWGGHVRMCGVPATQ